MDLGVKRLEEPGLRTCSVAFIVSAWLGIYGPDALLPFWSHNPLSYPRVPPRARSSVYAADNRIDRALLLRLIHQLSAQRMLIDSQQLSEFSVTKLYLATIAAFGQICLWFVFHFL